MFVAIQHWLTRCIQSEARGTLATIRAVCVDASTASLANPAVELTFIDVCAALAIHLRITLGTLAEGMVTDLARAAPGYSD